MTYLKRLSVHLCILIAWFPSTFTLAKYTNETKNYSFYGELLFREDQTILIKYVNRSRDMQCIRAYDLGEVLANSFVIIKGKTDYYVRRKNTDGFPSSYTTPKQFYVVPPGGYVSASIKLSDYYHFLKGAYIVKYYIPIVLCKALEHGYIAIPAPHGIADFIRDRGSEIVKLKEIYREIYPKWAENGFIAEMDPVQVIVGQSDE